MTLRIKKIPDTFNSAEKSSIEQILDDILEDESRTTSIQVSSLEAEASAKLDRCCQSCANMLRRKLCGYMDWFTLKAIENYRTCRYKSVSKLATNIQWHLNIEPVTIGLPAMLYRMQKCIFGTSTKYCVIYRPFEVALY